MIKLIKNNQVTEIERKQIKKMLGEKVNAVKNIIQIEIGKKLIVTTCNGSNFDHVYFSNVHGAWGFPVVIN